MNNDEKIVFRKKNFLLKRIAPFLLICFCLILVFSFYLFFKNKDKNVDTSLIGKIVMIDGDKAGIGLVEEYEKGKFIAIKTVDNLGAKPIFFRLNKKKKIDIVANSLKEYLDSKNTTKTGTNFSTPNFQEKEVNEISEISHPLQTEESTKDEVKEENTIGEQKTETELQGKVEDVPSSVQDREESEKTYTELQREKGIKIFESTVAQLAVKSDELDIQWKRYEDACAGQYTVGDSRGKSYVIDNFGRSWFVFWEGDFRIANESTVECRKISSDISRLSFEIKKEMQEAMEKARKMSVYPGQVRDIRRKYRMDWKGWD